MELLPEIKSDLYLEAQDSIKKGAAARRAPFFLWIGVSGFSGSRITAWAGGLWQPRRAALLLLVLALVLVLVIRFNIADEEEHENECPTQLKRSIEYRISNKEFRMMKFPIL
jgi:hypothetical protein